MPALERPAEGVVRFVPRTYGSDLGAVRAYAGEPVEQGERRPKYRGFLLELEPEGMYHPAVGGAGGVRLVPGWNGRRT